MGVKKEAIRAGVGQLNMMRVSTHGNKEALRSFSFFLIFLKLCARSILGIAQLDMVQGMSSDSHMHELA
jgi:hypothetical protein